MEYCYDNLNKSCVKVSRSVGMKTALYLIILLIVLTTIFGNLLVIVSISHFKQLHSPHNLLVLSLATADLLLGLCVLPFSMIRTVETCWYLGSFFCTVSIFHLGFIAIDRYFAVCDPLHYSKKKISIGVVCCFIAVAWVMSAFYSFGLIFPKANDEGLENVVPMLTCEGGCIIQFNKLWSLLDALTFVIPCFGMICIYAQIFNVARKQARQIQSRDFKIFSLDISKQRAKRKREQKAAKTLGIVMGVFLACWSPLFNDTVVDAYNNYQTPTTAFDGLIWLAYSNSTFNPLIYGFFYPWFRKALKLIITFKIFQSHSSLIQLYKESFCQRVE
ncbi:trace amine-associated receptor 13c-like [Erpetoichthys calabaricus]|uniref:trace amine-associated receptor 13c-like n=1 Tax=Erpetoichthys calabaricus TaxID=27687 RepID=UPI0010A0A825|nr:trace amine-associated receptor 13c-like [Erpetoichthys calabaricus]